MDDVLLGRAEPTVLVVPDGVVSLADADEAIGLAELAGLEPDESQRITLRATLGTSADGRWSAPTVADIEPRQNGKGDTIVMRQLHGLFNLGEPLQIYTAHEFPTANEMFLRLVGIIEGNDWLRRRVARVRYANGEQGVELLGQHGGGRLKYRARTGGSARGFAGVTTVYYDESLYVTDAHLGASLPALSTAADHSPRGGQLWYASSALLASSAVVWRLRRQALAGTLMRAAWVEHTAEYRRVDGALVRVDVDPDDRVAWAQANPALGHRIPVEHIEAERANMSPAVFLRERLGVCDPELGAEDGPWPPEVWAAVQAPDAVPEGARMLGVDANPERTATAIVGVAANGVVGLVDQPSPSTLAARVVDVATRQGCPVALDRAGPAAFIVADVEAAGVAVVDVSGRALHQACGEFDTAVRAGVPRVRSHSALDGAVRAARVQVSGDVWRWARRDLGADVSPLVAATVAWWGLKGRQSAEPLSQIY